MRRRVAFVFGLLLASAAQAQDGPFDRDPPSIRGRCGSKRVPVLSIDPDGGAQIDLWCKRGQGEAAVAGDTITIAIGAMRDGPCTPERAQADEDMIAALSAVTN
jgi:hypothetical protein